MRRRWIGGATAALLLFAGCTSDAPDAALCAVTDTRSATVGAHLAAGLWLDGRSTTQVTQVVLEDAVDAAAESGTELAGASDVDPARVETARSAVGEALDVLDRLSDRGASALTPDDLAELEAAVAELDAAGKELSR